ncbi:MAG: DNA polymerase III subunit beta [Patescibacteria group bacterium]
MKFSCNKINFQRAVNLAERISGKSQTLPVLSSLFIKAENNKVLISSTNLEVGFETSIPVKVEKEGVAVVPAKTLVPLLSSISDETIAIEGGENTIRITSPSSSTNVKCLPVEEFPIIPRIKKERSFTIPAHLLSLSIRNIISAASTSYTRPELASVHIVSEEKGGMTFVATDSFRLAEQKVDIGGLGASILLPYKNAQELLRIIEDIDDDIEVIYNKNQAVFTAKQLYFVSRLTEGDFPNYHSILPVSFTTQVVIDKNQLQAALRAASVFSTRLSDVFMKIIAKDGVIEIRSQNSESGEHNSLCRAQVSGEDIESTFNYNYLFDALKSIPHEKVFLGFSGTGKPVLLRGEGDSAYLHLVMPMRGV